MNCMSEPDIEREVSAHSLTGDSARDASIRPRTFSEFVGQEKVCSRIKVAGEAAKLRGEPLDHVLLSCPPGLGKTSLAQIIAEEMGVQLHATSGPAVDKKGDLAGILTQLQPGDLLFVDEIHRLNAVVEENLYPAMEDFHFDVIMGTGPGAHTIRLPLNRFTLVGATTRAGLLTAPLRSRFGIVERVDFYSAEELQRIVERAAKVHGLKITSGGAEQLARRSRGTPRIVNRLLRRIWDYALVQKSEQIDEESARSALAQLEVDENGFDRMDRMLLETIVIKFDGGPVGLDTLAAATGESTDAIEDVYEPFLLQQGFIQRTPRGRIATRRAFELVGRPLPDDEEPQGSLGLS